MQRIYGIPRSMWLAKDLGDEAPKDIPAQIEKPKRVKAAPASPPPRISTSVALVKVAGDAEQGLTANQMAKEQLERVLRKLDEAYQEDRPIFELTQLEKLVNTCVTNYSRLTGERDLSVSMILRSASWAQVMRTVHQAILPFPQAAKALADAIEAIEGYGTES
jgi:hypothetical protein